MQQKIKLLKKIDALFSTLVPLIPAPGMPAALPAPGKVLVIRPGGVGDAILLIPALNALKNSYPGCELTLLAERRNAAAFALCPAADRVLLYDDFRQLREAIGGSYDVVIDTEQWHTLSAFVARLCRGTMSIGFATNRRQKLFSHRIAYSHDDYEVDSFFNLLAPLGIARPERLAVPFLTVPEQAAARVAELLRGFERPFVTIFPGASIAERRWGAERFRQSADHLALRGLQAVVVGGAEDAEDGEWIVKRCGGINLAGKTTLAETAAAIARSLLLVSGDSGVLHMAVGLGVPTVSLFGPGIEAKWGPRGEFDLPLNKRLPCSPCTRFGTTPHCKIDARCLSEITPGELVNAVLDVLTRRFPE